jgi:two-component system cell cycle sensor histidine kinase/response regulator CckA
MTTKLDRVAIRTGLIFWIVAVLWILLSDRALVAFVKDPALANELQTYKGWFFVTVTALLLGWVLHVQLHRWENETAERTRAEADLRLFRLLMDNSTDALLIVEPDTGNVLDANETASRQRGYSRAEFLRLKIREIADVPSERFRWDEFVEHVKKEGMVVFEGRDRHKNGNTFPVEISVRYFMQDGRPFLVYATRDITERKQAEAGRKSLESQLRQAQKMEAIGQLAAGVAHDFNNLLTVIQGNATVLTASNVDGHMIGESVQQITDAVKRAAGLTRQLLIFGRRQTIRPANLDLNAVVINIIRMLQRILGEDILLQTNYASDLPLLHGDAGMIEQIIMNLAVNSRDAMPAGGQLVISTGTASVDAKQAGEHPEAKPGNYVFLAVTDTGSGIAPEHLPHIFEPFFTTKEVGKGTGLGLATVYGIVQQHHGWMTVKSEVNHGTTFTIYIPALSSTQSEQKSDTTHFSKAPTGSETILVVEDEAPVRAIICHALERCGYTVLQAASGIAAMDVWREHRNKIQLLLTDMIMPAGLNGYELAQRLLAEKPGLKVLYASGYTAEHPGMNISLVEGVNFLQKPFNIPTLAKLVRETLDRSPIIFAIEK